MDKIKIKMKESKKGSPDGITVNVYEKGVEYTIPEELANVFVEVLKVATKVREKKVAAKKPIMKTAAIKRDDLETRG